MLIDARRDPEALAMIVAVGGDAGLISPRPHQRNRTLSGEPWAFLEDLPLCHETDTRFFVHANYAPNRPLSDQDSQTALWLVAWPLGGGTAIPSLPFHSPGF